MSSLSGGKVTAACSTGSSPTVASQTGSTGFTRCVGGEEATDCVCWRLERRWDEGGRSLEEEEEEA